MPDIIRLLPDSIANQIAAGEVIQRPASVIKELMENSVDAGATSISISIVDAGKTSIQVVDNGKGMSETDARLSFERHATSKISNAADLFNLRTMGFRGEALASIVAVAQVEVKTRMKDDEIGTYLFLEASRLKESKLVACNVGTSMTVNNLFFNVPARRRFLKSNQTECNNVMTEFERVALIHPEISFLYLRDDVQIMNLRSCSFRKRIVDLFGTALDKQLFPVQVETSIVKITGFIGTPQSAKSKGARQFFFVNKRYMKHPYFHRAVMTAYERLIPSEKQVPYFLCLDVDPQKIDVNIHPTKTEIKFEDDQPIWQILLAAVRESLGKFDAAPTIDFEMGNGPEIPTINNVEVITTPKLQFDPTYNPFVSTSKPSSYHRPSMRFQDWQKLYGNEDNSKEVTEMGSLNKSVHEAHSSLFFHEEEKTKNDDLVSDEASVYLQHKGCYIVTSVKSGLMVIDQHKASIRILYDKYMVQLTNGESLSQQLLFPEEFQIPIAQNEDFMRSMGYLKEMGFDILKNGNNDYQINGVPAGTEKYNPVQLLTEIFEELFYNKEKMPEEKIYSQMALALARRNAVPYGQYLTQNELRRVVEELFASTSPNYSPDGKIVLTILPNDRLESVFH